MINNNSKNFAEAAKDLKNHRKFNIFTDLKPYEPDEHYNYHYKSDFMVNSKNDCEKLYK